MKICVICCNFIPIPSIENGYVISYKLRIIYRAFSNIEPLVLVPVSDLNKRLLREVKDYQQTINMQFLKVLKLIITFYSSFFFLTTTITLCCILIFEQYGMSTFFSLFWFKIITLGLVYYFTSNYKAKEVYYFLNLGVSPIILWASTLGFDFLLFVISIIITYKINGA